MTPPMEVDKKTKKLIKRLTPWIKKLRGYQLFDIGKNAKYDREQLMELPLAAALQKTSIEHVSIQDENRSSADDFYHHANNKLTKPDILRMQLRYSAEICKLLKNEGSHFCWEKIRR